MQQRQSPRIIMVEVFDKESVLALSGTKATHVVCAYPVRTQLLFGYWKNARELAEFANETLPRSQTLVLRFKMIPTWSSAYGTLVRPDSRRWYRQLRKSIQATLVRFPRAMSLLDVEVNGAAKVTWHYDVYDVKLASEAQVRGGWGPSRFRCDFGMVSALSGTRVDIAAQPAEQPNSYRQEWATGLMSRRRIAPAYWTRRLDRVPAGDIAQLAINTNYETPDSANAAMDARPGMSFLLFPYTNNSAAVCKRLRELWRTSTTVPVPAVGTGAGVN